MLEVKDTQRVDDLLASIDKFLRENELRRRPPQDDSAKLARPAHVSSTILQDYQTVIDDTLQLVYSQHHRIISRLYPAAMPNVSLEQLREGPLGEDLSRLASIAMGAMRAGRNEVLGAIDSVLQLLFWPVGWEYYTVPRSFWEQPLGKMLSLAKLRSFQPEDLVSIGNAANMLNVTRSTIYRWLDDKVLDYVRDDMSGRTFVVKHDVEAMKVDLDAEIATKSTHDAETEAPRAVVGAQQLALWDMQDLQQHQRSSNSSRRNASLRDEWEHQTLEKLAEIAHELKSVIAEPEDEQEDSNTTLRIRINEEPLNAQTIAQILTTLTILHTKLWLIGHDRLADVVRYSHAHSPQFEREANLVITRLSYNSPADVKLDVGVASVREALSALTADAPEGRGKLARLWDDIDHADLRRQQKDQEVRAREDGLSRDREWFDQQLAERRQAMVRAQHEAGHEARMQALQEREMMIALKEKELELEARHLAIEREKSALQVQRFESELNRLKAATDTAVLMIERLRPDVSDPVVRAVLAQELVPQLLQLESTRQIRFSLPTPGRSVEESRTGEAETDAR